MNLIFVNDGSFETSKINGEVNTFVIVNPLGIARFATFEEAEGLLFDGKAIFEPGATRH